MCEKDWTGEIFIRITLNRFGCLLRADSNDEMLAVYPVGDLGINKIYWSPNESLANDIVLHLVELNWSKNVSTIAKKIWQKIGPSLIQNGSKILTRYWSNKMANFGLNVVDIRSTDCLDRDLSVDSTSLVSAHLPYEKNENLLKHFR